MQDKWKILGDTCADMLKGYQQEVNNVFGDVDKIKDKDQKEFLMSMRERTDKAVESGNVEEINGLINELNTNMKSWQE